MRPRIHVLALAGLLVSAWARPSAADCTVDTDCPGATCGSSVCQWSVGGHACVPAGTDPQPYDGWCTNDAQCKCGGEGATCTASQHCTFTVPQSSQSAPSTTDAGTSSTAGGTANPAGCTVVPGNPGGGGSAVIVLACLACAAALRASRARGRSRR